MKSFWVMSVIIYTLAFGLVFTILFTTVNAGELAGALIYCALFVGSVLMARKLKKEANK